MPLLKRSSCAAKARKAIPGLVVGSIKLALPGGIVKEPIAASALDNVVAIVVALAPVRIFVLVVMICCDNVSNALYIFEMEDFENDNSHCYQLDLQLEQQHLQHFLLR